MKRTATLSKIKIWNNVSTKLNKVLVVFEIFYCRYVTCYIVNLQ